MAGRIPESLSLKNLAKLAEKVFKWERLAIVLDFEQADIERFVADNPNNQHRLITFMLDEWVSKNAGNDPLRRLGEALGQAGLVNLKLELERSSGSFGLTPGTSSSQQVPLPDLAQEIDLHGSGMVLYKEAADGNTDRVRKIIKRQPNANDRQGCTPLHEAAYNGHLDVAVMLVENKAPLERQNDDGDVALASAVLGNQPSLVHYLLVVGSNINVANKEGETPLHRAVVRGYDTCVKVLIEHQAEQRHDVNHKDNHGNTPLFLAITKNERKILQLLLKHPDVDLRLTNNENLNCLHYAASTGNNVAVEEMLKAEQSLINSTTADGLLALHLAAFKGYTDVVLTLVKQVNRQSDLDLKTPQGDTALHLAADQRHRQCVEALVNHGADVNAQNGDGNTSLHLIVMKISEQDFSRKPLRRLMVLGLRLLEEHLTEGETSDEGSNLIKMTLFLLKNGADIDIENNEGDDVCAVTAMAGVESMIKSFEKRL